MKRLWADHHWRSSGEELTGSGLDLVPLSALSFSLIAELIGPPFFILLTGPSTCISISVANPSSPFLPPCSGSRPHRFSYQLQLSSYSLRSRQSFDLQAGMSSWFCLCVMQSRLMACHPQFVRQSVVLLSHKSADFQRCFLLLNSILSFQGPAPILQLHLWQGTGSFTSKPQGGL